MRFSFKKSAIRSLQWMAVGALLVWSGCASTSMSIQVLVPAHINVPQEIQMLALVNRYKPEKNEALLNVLEGRGHG